MTEEIDDLEFLGELRNILPGNTYEEKVKFLFDCVEHAHEKGYSICNGRECSIAINAAYSLLREGTPLAERQGKIETYFKQTQETHPEGRTIEELIQEVRESKKD